MGGYSVNERRAVAAMAVALALSTAVTSSQAAEEKSAKPAASAPKASKAQIDRGRYLLTVGSCNDCHTAGFAPNDGNLPEKEWQLGSVGDPVPAAYLPPDKKAPPPYIQWPMPPAKGEAASPKADAGKK